MVQSAIVVDKKDNVTTALRHLEAGSPIFELRWRAIVLMFPYPRLSHWDTSLP